MQYEPVDSSLIEAVAYDPDARELGVRFKGGRCCCVYQGLTAADHEALLGADSIGRHFHQAIRDQYPWRHG